MSRMRCWWLHRRQWTIVSRGLLPFGLDTDRFCPVCHRGPGHPVLATRLWFRLSAT